MTPTARYFRACELYDRAEAEGAKPARLKRLKAWEKKLAKEAREAMRTPFTIADLFDALNKSLS